VLDILKEIVMKFLIDRLKERSTWLGLTTLLTALGVALNPELKESIAVAGVSVGGLIAALTQDK